MSYLRKPAFSYEIPFRNNLEDILEVIQPADVVLVSGNTKLSKIIQMTTGSPWSHCALYSGEGMVIEADDVLFRMEGDEIKITRFKKPRIIQNPLEKFLDMNIRIKRPIQLCEEDRQRVIEEMNRDLEEGREYDENLIFKLLLNKLGFTRLCPLEDIGSADNYLCAGVIVNKFQDVDYPIRPFYILVDGGNVKPRKRHYSHFVPGDFDLAEQVQWQTVSFVKQGDHYRDIEWAD